MVTLTAVVPDGLTGVVDHDGVGRYHGGVWLDGHEAGEEAVGCWHVVLDGLAWSVECRLNDAVILYGPAISFRVSIGNKDNLQHIP